ncbi:DNA polymerase III subunit epsilon [Sphingomonas sp.]|jgi:DNA polymerase-3 subunit epsilon|uniref:DNA polymerase III subunit epsilon n=1 Tax=Sphingomonas sp. TaxID=28214 RepID=UPI002DB84C10|nr:DNA polymerase III subunit epsilon [Sphingomonas sp.]HEU4969042.1 DNA polymerase III subunit epsilon [Sphingomonas sp.]
MREVVFDTETTGIQVSEGHRMVEIGCVELINRVETGREFHAYFNPERSMPPEAQAVHGLGDAFLAGQRLFRDVCEELLDFLEDSPLVAHNAAFDFAFLNFELGECGRLHVPRSRMVDTLALSRTKFPGAKHSLDAMCARFGVDRSHRIKHGALLDAQLLSQCYVELTGGRQIGLSLAEAPAAADAVKQDAIVYDITRTVRPARPHAASPEELERHARFLAQIADPVWTMGTAA